MNKKIYIYAQQGHKYIKTVEYKKNQHLEIIDAGNDAPRGGKLGNWVIFGERDLIDVQHEDVKTLFKKRVDALEVSQSCGCQGHGKIWYSIDNKGKIRMLYMSFLNDNPFFAEYRDLCRAYLAQFGDVKSGESTWLTIEGHDGEILPLQITGMAKI